MHPALLSNQSVMHDLTSAEPRSCERLPVAVRSQAGKYIRVRLTLTGMRALNKITDDSISLPSTYCANKFYPYKYVLTPVLPGSSEKSVISQ